MEAQSPVSDNLPPQPARGTENAHPITPLTPSLHHSITPSLHHSITYSAWHSAAADARSTGPDALAAPRVTDRV
jgi:hypothetical protein